MEKIKFDSVNKLANIHESLFGKKLRIFICEVCFTFYEQITQLIE